CLQRTNWPLTF
nr:immunoglobulin light chain junction region [Macaca mulatta]